MNARRALGMPVLVLLLAGAPALAQDAPVLAVHVTDLGADAFVAIYGRQAVELTGCTDLADARALLQLPSDTPVQDVTLDGLQADFGLGLQPRLPCGGVGFDADWPATAPIWADVEGSGTYLLPALTGTGFIGVPARCTAIKTALAIRERLQLPGVLQSTAAPPGLGTPDLVLGCGAGGGAGAAPPVAMAASGSGWSLHRFETFLTEDSQGDTIYALRNIARDGAVPAYLPILRVDGQDTRDIILTGGPAMIAVEDALSLLIGAAPGGAVGLLGSDEVPAVREALFADLCLTECTGHIPAHAVFQRPGIDLGLTVLPPLAATAGIDVLGADLVSVTYAEGRAVSFADCPSLTAALGLATMPGDDWFAQAGATLDAAPVAGRVFDCRTGGPQTCVRRLAEGQALTIASLTPGTDCPGARHLLLELGAVAAAPEPLVLQGLAFDTVTLLPARGLARSRLVVTPGLRVTSSDLCVLSPAPVLITASGLARLTLERIDLERRASATTGSVVALQAQGGTLVLDQVGLGAAPDGAAALQRGVNLCRADLYARASRILADEIGIQGLSARVLLSGAEAGRMVLGQARFGILMATGSQVVLRDTDIGAAGPIILRGAVLQASRTILSALAPVPPTGSAVLLERGAQADLTISTLTGFRCAASFLDAASRLAMVLPGNDITRDNTFSACGPGQFSLIE